MNGPIRRQISIFTLSNTLERKGCGDGFCAALPVVKNTKRPTELFNCFKQKFLKWSWGIAMMGGITIGGAVLFRTFSSSRFA